MINCVKLLSEANTAGIPVDSVNSDGRWTFTRALTKDEETKLAQIIAVHDPTPDPLPPTADERLDKLLTILVEKRTLDQVDVTAINTKD